MDDPERPTASARAPTDGAALPGGPKHCVVCQQPVSAFLTVAPVCVAHGQVDALEQALAEARTDLHDVIGGLQSAQALILAYAEWVRATFPIDTEQNGAEQALLDYAAALLAAGS